MSIGAKRSRLIRQLLVESGLLASAGAALGVLFAWGLLRLLAPSGPQSLPVSVAPDRAVLAFTLAVTTLTVLLFGTAPALYATRLELAPS